MELKTRLCALIQENPELPVVPMVDEEVVCDDTSAYWMGRIESVEVDEYIVTDRGMLCRSDDDVFDALESYMGSEAMERLPDTEDGCRPYYDKLPWIRAILVYIGTPEWSGLKPQKGRTRNVP